MVKEMAKEIEVQYLQVLVMPNGEVIFSGKTVGWGDEMKKYLVKADRIKEEK